MHNNIEIDVLLDIVVAVVAAVVEEQPDIAINIRGRVRIIMRERVGVPRAFDAAERFLARLESEMPLDA